ncbi:unnamed protein product [Phytophthora fragariaefolia]|uniref:Unnamed protein product n=1 Tax=Phytophthora fragariaefolia TaxID=1490495 RepID=A0A9W7D3A8_9STRA|nr:unnamed protein product [Phytophthora fragariaefolia]
MVESQVPGNPTTTAHYYDGKFHMLPQNFEFPKVGAFGAWQLWWFGNGARGYPPLRRIGTHDLPRQSMRETFSNWANLMQRISDAALEMGCQVKVEMTEQEAKKCF